MKRLLVQAMQAQNDFMRPSQAEDAIDRVFAALPAALVGGGRVTIQGFGAFTRKFVAEREVRNPKTGERSVQPAHYVIKFKEAKRK